MRHNIYTQSLNKLRFHIQNKMYSVYAAHDVIPPTPTETRLNGNP